MSWPYLQLTDIISSTLYLYLRFKYFRINFEINAICGSTLQYDYIKGFGKHVRINYSHSMEQILHWKGLFLNENMFQFFREPFNNVNVRAELLSIGFVRHRSFFHFLFSRPIAARRLSSLSEFLIQAKKLISHPLADQSFLISSF